VLLIGGNRSSIGSIKAMRSAGFEVAVADKLPRQYALAEADIGLEIAPGDVEALDGAIRAMGGVDGIIGINEVAMLSAADLQLRFRLPGLPRSIIDRTISKLAQRRQWAGDPELFVPYQTASSAGEALRAADAVGGLPVIVKPDMSHGGSRGVSLVSDKSEVAAAFAFAQEHALPGSYVLIEQALSGPQFSAELLVKDSRTHVLALGRKIKSEPPYRVDLAIGYPGESDPKLFEAIERICSKATALLGISKGPGHIEFTLTSDGPRPIELAARCGGSITPDLAAHASGYHPMVEAARLACDLSTAVPISPAQRGAVLMFLAFPPCTARTMHIPADLSEKQGVIDFDCWLPSDGVIEPIRWTSQRSGYVGVVAEDGPSALARAQDIAAQIQLETTDGAFCRPLTFLAAV
jgi:biotin carboxylase